MTNVIDNANSAVVSSGGTDAPSPGTVEIFTVSTIADFDILSGSQIMPIIDFDDVGKTGGYEIMYVTANANGSDVSWTVTRGAEMTGGATVYAHQPNWIAVPVVTAATINPQSGSGGGGGVTPPVNLVSAFNTEMTNSPPSGAATVDGTAATTGMRVLLTAQDTGPDDGIWVANTSGDWTRPSDWATGNVIPDGMLIPAGLDTGADLFGSIWQLGGPITVDTDSPIFNFIYSPTPTLYTAQSAGSPILQANLYSLIVNASIELGGSQLINQVSYSSGTPELTYFPFDNLLESGVTAASLPAASASGNQTIWVKNKTGGDITVTPNGVIPDTIDDASSLVLPNLSAAQLWSDGVSDWQISASHGLG